MNYDKDWYKSLKKPSYQPDAKLFPVVWLILYVLMAISFFTVLFTPISFLKILAILLFIIQLAINLMWSDIFFRQKKIKKAYKMSIYLVVYLALTIYVFYFVSPLAAILLFPYILWCIFAAVLMRSIYKLNC